MKKIDIEKTEYLGKPVTPEGIEYWNKCKKRMVRKISPWIASDLLVNLLAVILLVALSFLLQSFINGIQETGKIDYIPLIAICAVIIFEALISLAVNVFDDVVQRKGLGLVSKHIYKNLLWNDEFLSKVKSGEIVQIAARDAEEVGVRLGVRFTVILCCITQIVIVLAAIFYFSWIAGLIVLAFYPLYFLVAGIVNKKIEQKSYIKAKSWADNSHIRLKGIQGWLELAVLKKRSFYLNKYNSSMNKGITDTIAVDKLKAVLIMFSFIASFYLPIISVVACTIPLFMGGVVNLASLLAVYMLAGYFSAPLDLLSQALQMLSEDKALYKRMSDILFIKPEDGDEGEDVGEIKDIQIEIDDYSYGGDELLLKDCRLHAVSGDMISVTGESGCGKSTLLKLLIKQNPYGLLHGSIKINGKPLQSLNKNNLYDNLQYVSQNYFVFEDTLLNNLCMGDEFAREEIDKVIDLCCLRNFVEEYGLDMMVKENGKNISQGQLQRMCIARALLRKPHCLLLDEPTSALDAETGDSLMENIAGYTKERGIITFVVSHKNDAIDRADKQLKLAKQ